MKDSPLSFSAVQNSSTNTVLTASNVQALTFIPWREKELVSPSLSLGFTQTTCDNEHQCCQIITEWKEPFMVAHLCGVPLVLGLWCVQIQNFCTSSLSFNIFLSHVGEILVLSSLFDHGGQRKHDHPSTLTRLKSNELDHLDVRSSCSGELKKISRGTHSELL